MHIWEHSCRDLLNLGIKRFLPLFGSGQHQHIPIRRLQCTLLKICFVLGVTVAWPTTFQGVQFPDYSGARGRVLVCDRSARVSALECDVLVGADGSRSDVSHASGFTRLSCRGALAIGVTANFVNLGQPNESSGPQLRKAYQYDQAFFNEVQAASGCFMENLVYHRCDTNHSFVFTPKKVTRGA